MPLWIIFLALVTTNTAFLVCVGFQALILRQNEQFEIIKTTTD